MDIVGSGGHIEWVLAQEIKNKNHTGNLNRGDLVQEIGYMTVVMLEEQKNGIGSDAEISNHF